MLKLALSGIRQRGTAFVAVFVAALLGSALIVLSGSLFETGIRLTAPPERLGGAPLVLIGDADYRMLGSDGSPSTDYRPYPERHRIEAAVPGQVAAIQDVAAAVPVRFFSATAGRAPGPVTTVQAQNQLSAALGPFALAQGAPPRAPDEIAVTPAFARALGLRPGASVRLAVQGDVADYRVTAVVGDASSPGAVFLAEDKARALAGDRLVDAVGVLLAGGADPEEVSDRIQARLPGVTVLAGDGRGAAENPAISAARTPMIVIGAVFGGLVLVVLATVVAAVISLSVRQRARELSLLRAAGATGRQARRLVVTETAVVGAGGALLGLLAGVPLSHLVFGVIVGAGAVPGALELELGLVPFGAALVLTSSVVCCAAWSAARPVRRARVMDAMRDVDVPPYKVALPRRVLGVVFLLGGVALAVVTCLMSPSVVSATSGPAALALSICSALLAPVALRHGLRLLRPLARLAGGRMGALGVDNVRARTVQLATVASCVALVLGIGGGNLGAQTIQLASQERASLAAVRADYAVTVPGGADPALIDTLAALPGVSAASALVTSGGWIERPYDGSHRDAPWPVRGMTARGAGGVLAGQVVAGSLSRLTGHTVALPATAAGQLGVRVGDPLRLRLGDGTAAQLGVVAVFRDVPGYESLLLPADLLAAHTTGRAVEQVVVRAADDAPRTAPALRERLERAVADRPGATVRGRDGIAAVVTRGGGVQALINALLVALVIGYAAIAVVNTVSISVMSRRREIAMLRLAGATRGQVRRLVLTEMAVTAAVGVVMGLVVAAGAVVPTAIALAGDLFTAASLAVLLGLLLVVGLLVVPATVIAVRRATAHEPAHVVTGLA
ncbi:ABC transporter permease [Nonomuraea sp. NPDC050783]|uniref:ABC transporter permease n=1 Tax=Nonomuraea sp. NPDC050783 TaxID=3154634 RepID=UPI00346632AC